MARKLACDFPLEDGSACGGCDRCYRREAARQRYLWPGVAEQQREAVKAHQEKHRDEINARRRANPWKEPDPQKELARKKARVLNKERKPCERCGETENVQKHHPDYSKPLEVIWLCRTCHGLEHRIA